MRYYVCTVAFELALMVIVTVTLPYAVLCDIVTEVAVRYKTQPQ